MRQKIEESRIMEQVHYRKHSLQDSINIYRDINYLDKKYEPVKIDNLGGDFEH